MTSEQEWKILSSCIQEFSGLKYLSPKVVSYAVKSKAHWYGVTLTPEETTQLEERLLSALPHIGFKKNAVESQVPPL